MSFKIGQTIHIRDYQGATPQEVKVAGIVDGKVISVKDKEGNIIEIIDQIISVLPIMTRLILAILSIIKK